MTARLGSQEPTFEAVGEWHHTFGPDAVRLFEGWGVRFYPCQRHEMDLFLARGADNRFACRTICVTKPRQNGKSFAVRFYAIWAAAVEGKHVLFTAHRGKTVRKMFRFMRGFVLHVASLSERLLPGGEGIYKAGGSEGIYFANGGLVEFATRTDGGGRGETYDVIVFDEAQHLTDEQYDAVVPTTIASESGDPQKIYLGTPPGPKMAGTVFREYHRKAHAGGAEGIWWVEWAAEGIPDMRDRMAVLELAYRTNPAMGYRIREDVMLDAIDAATSPDGFAREFLNWWAEDAVEEADRPIDAAEWQACRTSEPKREGVVAYAVKFSPDGRIGTLAACHRPEGGRPFVYVVASRDLSGGLGWLADTISEHWRKAAAIVVDGQSHAQALQDRLSGNKALARRLVRPSAREAVGAYSALVNAVREGSVTHYGQPMLDASATLCTRRAIGSQGGWGFQSAEGADATLVEAACLAYWAAMTTKRKPGRKAVVR